MDYDLFAVCHHYGRCGFGHYTATVRDWDVASNRLGDRWFHCDDDKVLRVADAEQALKTSSAYMLFYRRR